MSSTKRVSVGKSTTPKVSKAKKEKVEEPEQASDVEPEQVEEVKVVKKKATRIVKKNEEPKVEVKVEVKVDSEESDSDNEVTKWEHDESDRVTSTQEFNRKELANKELVNNEVVNNEVVNKTPVKETVQKGGKNSSQTENRENRENREQYSQHSEHHPRNYQPRNHNNHYSQNSHSQQRESVNKQQHSTALSFSYNDYRTINHNVTTVSTPDLIRFLIVRSHDDGQTGLKRCLENTLRAVNLECKFPTLPASSPRPQRAQGEHNKVRTPSKLYKVNEINEDTQ
jgi:hypothetical protein